MRQSLSCGTASLSHGIVHTHANACHVHSDDAYVRSARAWPTLAHTRTHMQTHRHTRARTSSGMMHTGIWDVKTNQEVVDFFEEERLQRVSSRQPRPKQSTHTYPSLVTCPSRRARHAAGGICACVRACVRACVCVAAARVM